MKRPSKKEIKALVEGLKKGDQGSGFQAPSAKHGKLSNKQDSKRIRKQGI